MPTQNQISTLPFENNITLNGLNKPDRSKLVFDLSGGWNVLDYIVTRNAPARQISGMNGVFQKPIMGVSVVQAIVASTTLNGTTLRVYFTDPTYDNFRLTEVVGDGTSANNQGKVIGHGAGWIDLEVAPPLTAWNTSLQFLAGSYCTQLYNAQLNRGSNSMESRYEYPVYVTNQTAISRGNVELYRRDNFETWVEFEGDYWDFAQSDVMMEQFARDQEYKGLFSSYGTSPSGDTNYSMGLKASIKDPARGGIYTASPSLMTETSFATWINSIANRRNARMTTLTFLVGRGFLSRIQGFTRDFIKYSGRNNTFGGENVKGLDVYTYTYNGVECNFIMAPILNDPYRFPTMSTITGASTGGYTLMSYTAICLDTDMYPAKGGGMLPASEKVYFGDKEMVMYYTPGVGMSSLKGSTGVLSSGDLALAVRGNDSVTVGIYSDSAYDFMSYRSGWFELTN